MQKNDFPIISEMLLRSPNVPFLNELSWQQISHLSHRMPLYFSWHNLHHLIDAIKYIYKNPTEINEMKGLLGPAFSPGGQSDVSEKPAKHD